MRKKSIPQTKNVQNSIFLQSFNYQERFSCLGQSERKGDQQIVRQANGEAVRKGYRKKNQQDDKEIERKNDHQNDPPEGNQGDA